MFLFLLEWVGGGGDRVGWIRVSSSVARMNLSSPLYSLQPRWLLQM